jgi:hypothetical protein
MTSFIKSKNDVKIIDKINKEKLVLPKETLYLIDKIIRKRIKDQSLNWELRDGILNELQMKKKLSKCSIFNYFIY